MNSLMVITEDTRDCIQEITNIAMGQAADSLAQFLGVFIHLSVPSIQLMVPQELNHYFEQYFHAQEDSIAAIRQGFFTEDKQYLKGEAIFFFTQTSAEELADLLDYDEALHDDSREELLLDIANILSSACLNGIAEQLETELGFMPPSVIGLDVSSHEVLTSDNLKWQQALLIEICYTLEERSFHCTLCLLMPDQSMRSVLHVIDSILEDL